MIGEGGQQLGLRWDLRGRAQLCRRVEEAVLRPGGADRLPGVTARLDAGQLAVRLDPGPLDVRGLWASQRALERAWTGLRTRLGDDALAGPTTELGVEVAGVQPDRDRLLDVACAAAPALLLLGGPGEEPLQLDVDGAWLRLLIPGPPPTQALAVIVGIVAALLRGGAPAELLHHPSLYNAEAAPAPLLIPRRLAGGRPVLAEGRMTSIAAETTAGRGLCVFAQQSLTALALHAEPEIAAMVAPDELEAVRRRILGELALPIDAPAAPPAPAVVTVAPSRRPVLLLLESGPRTRRDTGRIGKALASDARVEVIIAPWSQLDLTRDQVLVTGPIARPTDGPPIVTTPEQPVRVDSVFYYATNDERPLGLDECEQIALRQLGARGMLPGHLDRVCVVAEMLEECSRRGVPNNTPGAQGCFSAKDQLEYMIRGYIRETGRELARPETFVAAKAQVPTVLRRFGRRRHDCILKPTRGSRAENIQIILPGADWPPNQRGGPFVLQRLQPRPLLVDGHKMDLRTYLFVDVDSETVSRGSELVFVRRATAPYQRGLEAAEITNTSYSERHGVAPDIERLEDTRLPESLKTRIRRDLDELMTELVHLHFWWARRRQARAATPLTPNRVMLWGIDVVVCRGADGGPALVLIEANVYPQLYRRSPRANRYTEAMFRDEYLPLLLAARTRVAGGRERSGRAVPEAS